MRIHLYFLGTVLVAGCEAADSGLTAPPLNDANRSHGLHTAMLAALRDAPDHRLVVKGLIERVPTQPVSNEEPHRSIRLWSRGLSSPSRRVVTEDMTPLQDIATAPPGTIFLPCGLWPLFLPQLRQPPASSHLMLYRPLVLADALEGFWKAPQANVGDQVSEVGTASSTRPFQLGVLSRRPIPPSLGTVLPLRSPSILTTGGICPRRRNLDASFPQFFTCAVTHLQLEMTTLCVP